MWIYGTPRPPARPDATPGSLVRARGRGGRARLGHTPSLDVPRAARAGIVLPAGARRDRRAGPPRRGGDPAVPLPAPDGATRGRRTGTRRGVRPADPRPAPPGAGAAREQRARVREGPGRRPAHPGPDGHAGRDAAARPSRAVVRWVRAGLRPGVRGRLRAGYGYGGGIRHGRHGDGRDARGRSAGQRRRLLHRDGDRRRDVRPRRLHGVGVRGRRRRVEHRLRQQPGRRQRRRRPHRR